MAPNGGDVTNFADTSSTTSPFRSQTNAAVGKVRSLGAGLFEVGGVTIDKARRTVSFPASVQMTNGLIEYALVASGGKLYESLLRTEVEPYYIHLGVLLLGDKGSGGKNGTNQALAEVPRPRVTFNLSWRDGAHDKQATLEDWIISDKTGTNMSRETWVYTGSTIVNGVFLANRERSVVAILEDATALINNPPQGHEHQHIWRVNEKTIPPEGTALRMSIKLESNKESQR